MKISVIVPSHNRARMLPGCLDSLIRQSLPPDEIIVVDDRSTDNTEEIVSQFGLASIRYLRLDISKGAQSARNYGIIHARNDWIAFQDSDDLWHPDKLESQLRALSDNQFDPFTVIHGDGIKLNCSSGESSAIYIPEFSGNCHQKLLLHSGPMFPTILTSKQALIRIGMLDEKCPSYQEWDTAIQLSKFCKFIHLHKPLFTWVNHQGDTISKDFRRDVLGYRYVLEKNRKETIAFFGTRSWHRENIRNMIRAIKASLWADAYNMLENECMHLPYWLARQIIISKFKPAGLGVMFKILTL